MRQPIRRFLLAAVIVSTTWGSGGFAPSTARAYHTYQERLLDSTAYSLYRRRARLGLFRLSYGIADQIQISTYTAPWLLGLILEDVAPNIEFKSTFYDRRKLALSGSGGFLTGTVEQVTGLPESKARYYLMPLGLAASVRVNSRVSTHVGGIYTAVTGEANAGQGSSELDGAAVVDLLQFWGMVEWRLSRVVALTFTLRWVPYVSDTIVRGSLTEGGNPNIGVQLELEFFDLNNAFAVIPGFVFSWKRANIRLGVGYGDFFAEGFFFVVPRSVLGGVSPELDVFVRF